MNWLDTFSNGAIVEPIAMWLVVGIALLGMFAVSARIVSAQREVERLQSEVIIFAEASIRVAETLDQLLLGNLAATRVSHTSRRYLLSEAQAGLGSGESLDGLAERLGLSHDEVRLLHAARSAQGVRERTQGVRQVA